MAVSSQLNIKVVSSGIDKASKGLGVLSKQAQAAEHRTEQLQTQFKMANAQAKKMPAAFTPMRGSLTQLSYQLQDVAVQASMGTNAFIILGQQGPQIASLLGPMGAVLGVVIAVGAALAGMATATTKVSKEVDVMAGKVEDLTDAQREWYLLLAGEQLRDLEQQLKDLGSEYEVLENKQDQVINASGDFAAIRQFKEAQSSSKNLAGQQKELASTMDVVRAKIQETKDRMDDLTTGITTNKDSADSLTSAYSDLKKELEFKIELLGKTAREQAKLTAAQELGKNANQTQIESINSLIDAYFDKIESLKEAEEIEKQSFQTLSAAYSAYAFSRIEAEKEASAQRVLNAQEEAIELERAYSGLAGSVSGAFGSIADAIAASGDDASNTYKTIWALSKGFAVAQASLNFNSALLQVMADPTAITLPQKLANYAALAGAAGSLVSTISSIDYSGRLQGGQTNPNGTYMVGERGPELVTFGRDGGSVTSNSQMQNQSTGNQRTNYTVVNQTSGRIDSVEERRLGRDDVVLIVKETMPLEAKNSNSPFSKTQTRNTTQRRRYK